MFDREGIIMYKGKNGGTYASGIQAIEALYHADIDAEYRRDRCSSLLQSIERDKKSADLDKTERKNRSNLVSYLKKYIEYKDNPSAAAVTDVGLNTILYGPPGTGKTYHTAEYAVAVIENKRLSEVEGEPREMVMERYKKYKKDGRIAFTTFHQSYGYEEFIEGIRPVIAKGNKNDIQYEVKPGVFKRFCETASPASFDDAWDRLVKAAEENGGQYSFMRRSNYELPAVLRNKDTFVVEWSGGTSNLLKKEQIREQWLLGEAAQTAGLTGGTRWMRKANQAVIDELTGKYGMFDYEDNYVFIIDEINRGNISKIFGELITLIEPSKRMGREEETEAILPYSGEAFGVPRNVYIIGTMNTADRSVAAIDTALRRRFDFRETLPEPELLKDIFVGDISISELLRRINERIEVLYDREHTVGHAYFLPLKENPDIGTLAGIFEYNIIPLMQEYFYEDYEKIQLILGDKGKPAELQFVAGRQSDYTGLFKEEDIGLDDGYVYEINKAAFYRPEAYRLIYSD